MEAMGHGRDEGMRHVGRDPARCPLVPLGDGER